MVIALFSHRNKVMGISPSPQNDLSVYFADAGVGKVC